MTLCALVGHKVISQESPSKKGFILSDLLIPLNEIHDGGPPKDGIPAIDRPHFVAPDKADFLTKEEKVLGVYLNGLAKAYPVKILNWHEVVNDSFGDTTVAVTFCPLCGSGLSFLAEIEGQKRTFGVSGLLYNSDVLLYDRESESLWSQLMGKAISGPASGTSLQSLATEFISWGEWRSRHPHSLVLSTQTGHERDYAFSAYESYIQNQTLLFPVNTSSPRFNNKDKVIGIEVHGHFKAYPLKKLKRKKSPIVDDFQGEELFIYYNRKTGSARIENKQEEVLPAITLFWFAWYAFHPDTAVW